MGAVKNFYHDEIEASRFSVVPVQVPSDGPCVEVAESEAEWFALYENDDESRSRHLEELFETRAEAEAAARGE